MVALTCKATRPRKDIKKKKKEGEYPARVVTLTRIKDGGVDKPAKAGQPPMTSTIGGLPGSNWAFLLF